MRPAILALMIAIFADRAPSVDTRKVDSSVPPPACDEQSTFTLSERPVGVAWELPGLEGIADFDDSANPANIETSIRDACWPRSRKLWAARLDVVWTGGGALTR
jgi:hypothetical protein